jgi:hypothetical protein
MILSKGYDDSSESAPQWRVMTIASAVNKQVALNATMIPLKKLE